MLTLLLDDFIWAIRQQQSVILRRYKLEDVFTRQAIHYPYLNG